LGCVRTKRSGWDHQVERESVRNTKGDLKSDVGVERKDRSGRAIGCEPGDIPL
jgi:hypothetical protein